MKEGEGGKSGKEDNSYIRHETTEVKEVRNTVVILRFAETIVSQEISTKEPRWTPFNHVREVMAVVLGAQIAC